MLTQKQKKIVIEFKRLISLWCTNEFAINKLLSTLENNNQKIIVKKILLQSIMIDLDNN